MLIYNILTARSYSIVLFNEMYYINPLIYVIDEPPYSYGQRVRKDISKYLLLRASIYHRSLCFPSCRVQYLGSTY